MSADLTAIRQELQEVGKQILGGLLPDSSAWRGADVVITDQPLPPSPPDSFYPPQRPVVTVHVAELSWLFERLRDSFMPLLDGSSKIEFFGRLANAANRSCKLCRDTSSLHRIFSWPSCTKHTRYAMRWRKARSGT